MAYIPTNWLAEATKLGPTNLNKLEQGVADAHAAIPNLNAPVSVLPAAPVEGQTVDLEVAPGIYWRLTYRSKAADGSNIAGTALWFPSGYCPPLIAEPTAPATVTPPSGQLGAAAWVDASDGPQRVTLPAGLGGDFDVTVSAQAIPATQAGYGATVNIGYAIGAAAPSSNDATVASTYEWNEANLIETHSTSIRTRRKTNIAAGAQITVRYAGDPTQFTLTERRLAVAPARCFKG